MKENQSLVLGKFLDLQDSQEKEMLFGVFKDRNQTDKVTLILWIERTSCFSDFRIELPEDVIKTVEPTSTIGYYAGKRLLLAKVSFNDQKLRSFFTPEELFRQIRINQLGLDLSLLTTDVYDDDISVRGINQSRGRGLGKHMDKRSLDRPIM